MVPENLFNLAKPTTITEVNFSNYKSTHLTVDALAAIVTCISLHQHKVRRLIFNSVEMD